MKTNLLQSFNKKESNYMRHIGKYTRFPWNLFEKVTVEYGESQIRVPAATAGDSVIEYLRPSQGATICVMSYNFPNGEWGNKTEWFKWMVYQNDMNKVNFRAVGGPEIEARSSLEELIKKGILEVRRLVNPETSHVLFVTTPRQLWVETYHKEEGYARDCYFTDTPYPETWLSAVERFETLWKSGEKFAS